ncbi:MAG: biopolymer transporter ExbD [Rhodospirillales bacterium]|nr:MAG: biopolymer transporter ExbD [Rhodospirillales bacterium]
MRATWRQQRPASNPDDRILPLINVVFLLLIFFMLAGRLAAPDPFDVVPPHSVSRDQASPQDVMILIGADGRLALDGVVMAPSELQAAVADRMATHGAARARLKADGRAEAVAVVAAMALLRDAGVEHLVLLTAPHRP